MMGTGHETRQDMQLSRFITPTVYEENIKHNKLPVGLYCGVYGYS